jgi:WD40 repeat protein
VAGSDGTIRVFDSFTDEDPSTIDHHSSAVHGLAVKVKPTSFLFRLKARIFDRSKLSDGPSSGALVC